MKAKNELAGIIGVVDVQKAAGEKVIRLTVPALECLLTKAGQAAKVEEILEDGSIEKDEKLLNIRYVFI